MTGHARNQNVQDSRSSHDSWPDHTISSVVTRGIYANGLPADTSLVIRAKISDKYRENPSAFDGSADHEIAAPLIAMIFIELTRRRSAFRLTGFSLAEHPFFSHLARDFYKLCRNESAESPIFRYPGRDPNL